MKCSAELPGVKVPNIIPLSTVLFSISNLIRDVINYIFSILHIERNRQREGERERERGRERRQL